VLEFSDPLHSKQQDCSDESLDCSERGGFGPPASCGTLDPNGPIVPQGCGGQGCFSLCGIGAAGVCTGFPGGVLNRACL
jgi:hypothetical protein